MEQAFVNKKKKWNKLNSIVFFTMNCNETKTRDIEKTHRACHKKL